MSPFPQSFWKSLLYGNAAPAVSAFNPSLGARMFWDSLLYGRPTVETPVIQAVATRMFWNSFLRARPLEAGAHASPKYAALMFIYSDNYRPVWKYAYVWLARAAGQWRPQ